MRIRDNTPIAVMSKRAVVISSLATGAKISVDEVPGRKPIAVELRIRLSSAKGSRLFLDELCREAVNRLSLAVYVDEEHVNNKEVTLLFSGVCLNTRGTDNRTLTAHTVPIDSLALLAAIAGYPCKQDILHLFPEEPYR